MNKTDSSTQSCPHAKGAAAEKRADVSGPMIHLRMETEGAPQAAKPSLYTFSQVESLATTIAWMQQFLARPHPELGRSGPVCPYVPGAIAQDTIWLGTVTHGSGERQAIKESVVRFRDLFLELEPNTGDGQMMKAIVIVFPNISIEDAAVIDEVQLELKPHFVEAGLMIGEFHERNEGEGLRNPEFRPLRSPIPSLAIRFMVETDFPFLQRMFYPPELRASFIKSYLRRFGGSISRPSFDNALSALVTAEIQLRGAEMRGGMEDAAAAPLHA